LEKQSKRATAHPVFMFHYAFWTVWNAFSSGPKLQNDAFHSQTDARSEVDPILIHSVHKLMQSVAQGEIRWFDVLRDCAFFPGAVWRGRLANAFKQK